MNYEKRYITDQEFDTLMYFSNFKIRAILSILRYTGIRSVEALTIKMHHLDLKKSTIQIQIRKKKKITWVYKWMPDVAMDHIKIYLHYKKCESEWLFPAYYNSKQHYGHLSLYKHLKRTSKKLNIDTFIRPHELRRKFALDFYKKSNYDINLTAMALNHRDLSSIHHYIRILDIAKERKIVSMF